MSSAWSRRALLARLVAVGTAGGLAGCPRDDGPGRTPERRTSPSPAESPTPTEAPARGPAGNETPAVKRHRD